jgi:hypothetical protein
MKIQRGKEMKGFEPITITLTVETQKELDTLILLTKFDETIPDLIGEREGKNIVKSFLEELRTNLVV